MENKKCSKPPIRYNTSILQPNHSIGINFIKASTSSSNLPTNTSILNTVQASKTGHPKQVIHTYTIFFRYLPTQPPKPQPFQQWSNRINSQRVENCRIKKTPNLSQPPQGHSLVITGYFYGIHPTSINGVKGSYFKIGSIDF